MKRKCKLKQVSANARQTCRLNHQTYLTERLKDSNHTHISMHFSATVLPWNQKLVSWGLTCTSFSINWTRADESSPPWYMMLHGPFTTWIRSSNLPTDMISLQTSVQRILMKGCIACYAITDDWMISFAAYIASVTSHTFQWAEKKLPLSLEGSQTCMHQLPKWYLD